MRFQIAFLLVGIGITIAFALLPIGFPEMPHSLIVAGILFGILISLTGLVMLILPQKSKNILIIPSVIKNGQWVSARIINPLNKVIECYCIWRTIEINGKIRDDVKQYITSHSTRVSWSGGDTNGATEGIKHIDDEGILNIATPTNAGLKFETAKGGREFGLDKDYGKGEYKIGFELKYRPLGEGEFQSKLFDVNFSCWIEPRRIVRVFSEGDDKFEDVDIIICEVGPQLFTGNNQVLCLYLKIIREED